jgi:ketosteroid isomerase-like protein
MITEEFAVHFAQDWIESWNAHDLDRILSHYADDFEMTSPLIVSVMSVPSGTLRGKEKIREYWAKALGRRPELKFHLQKVTFGVDSLAAHFRSETGGKSVEWFFFTEDGKVIKSLAHHGEILISN